MVSERRSETYAWHVIAGKSVAFIDRRRLGILAKSVNNSPDIPPGGGKEWRGCT